MIIIGSDHAGIDLKNKIIKYFDDKHIEYLDIRKNCAQDGDDYSDVSLDLCENVLKNADNLGIIICGTGIGVCISCNKINGIRAALCTEPYMAETARKHNKANVLCLGSRLECLKNEEYTQTIVQTFIDNLFEGGRHDRRVNKISELEKINKEGGK